MHYCSRELCDFTHNIELILRQLIQSSKLTSRHGFCILRVWMCGWINRLLHNHQHILTGQRSFNYHCCCCWIFVFFFVTKDFLKQSCKYHLVTCSNKCVNMLHGVEVTCRWNVLRSLNCSILMNESKIVFISKL